MREAVVAGEETDGEEVVVASPVNTPAIETKQVIV